MAMGMAGLGYSAHRLLQAASRPSKEDLADEDLQKAQLADYAVESGINNSTPKFALAPAAEPPVIAVAPADAASVVEHDTEAQQASHQNISFIIAEAFQGVLASLL